jgi:hypothetical protein
MPACCASAIACITSFCLVSIAEIILLNLLDGLLFPGEDLLRFSPPLFLSEFARCQAESSSAYGYFVLLAVCSAICSAKFGFFLPGRTLNG